MPHEGTISVRIREDDYAVAESVIEEFPGPGRLRVVDVVGAWRRCWEGLGNKTRTQRLMESSAARPARGRTRRRETSTN